MRWRSLPPISIPIAALVPISSCPSTAHGATADANPYLVLAAILAGIHHGIVNKIEPDEPAEGNACDVVDEDIPFFLPSALKRLRNSSVMREYLGAHYVDVYAETKMLEFDKFQRTISPLEYDWYL